MKSLVFRLALIGIALFASGLHSVADAQEPPPVGAMGVWVPDPADLGLTGYTITDETGGLLAAFADDQFCDSFAFDEPMLIVIGAAGQPDVCRVAGAQITFASGRGHMMSFSTTFAADDIVVFNNFAPWPPHSFYPPVACEFFATVGVESTSCQMISPPGPSVSGNLGLAAAEADSPFSRIAMLALVVLGTVVMRSAIRGREPDGSGVRR